MKQVKTSSAKQTPQGLGAITLARHGEPALSRRVKLDAQGYEEWWAKYEVGGLLEGQIPPRCLLEYAKEAKHIFSSTRLRAIETAQAVCGGRPFEQLDMLIEAPLPAPRFPSFIKMTPKSTEWGTVSRFWWYYFNYHRDMESRAEAEARARQATEFLLEKAKDGDVLVLAHGFFNYLISLELKKMGFTKTIEQGFRYWGCRRYEQTRKPQHKG